MEGGSSPSRHREKRSKKNKDCAAVPKPPGCTKASYKHGGPAGSRAARGRGDQGSSATVPPPAPAFVGDMPIVDEAEEALERARRTIATPPFAPQLAVQRVCLSLFRSPVCRRSCGSPPWLPILLVPGLLFQWIIVTGLRTSGTIRT